MNVRSLSDSPCSGSALRAAAAFQRRKQFLLFSAVTSHRAKSRRIGRGAGRSSGGNLSTAQRKGCLILRRSAEIPPQDCGNVQSAGVRIDSHGVRMTHKECGFSHSRGSRKLSSPNCFYLGGEKSRMGGICPRYAELAREIGSERDTGR